MGDDQVVGDGGNQTVYERPDGSRYALDHNGRGVEWGADEPIFGRARFDARESSTGVWDGSRCTPQRSDQAVSTRARRHGRPKAV
jgi:hypothetical protein